MPGAVAKLSWGHVNLNVSDLGRSVAFYELLSFVVAIPGIPYLNLERDEVHDVPTEAASALGFDGARRGRGLIMALGEGFPMLDLTQWQTPAAATSVSASAAASDDFGFVRLCLGSRDLDGDYERLRAAGVDFLSKPTPGHEQMAKIALCRDPDGNLIELIQLNPEAWRA